MGRDNTVSGDSILAVKPSANTQKNYKVPKTI